MKDLEKIKSEDLGCQVQDANPGNFGIEQEVAQLVGATVPAPTEPSADDARELGAQLLVFLRRALTPIQSALRTALAAIYSHLDSRCTDYTPAAYAPYSAARRAPDPMGSHPARSVANLLTAITAFAPRKISNGGATNDGIPDGMSLAHLLCEHASVVELKDDNSGWVLSGSYSPTSTFPNLTKVTLGCEIGSTIGYGYWGGILLSSDVEYHLPNLKKITPQPTGVGFNQGLLSNGTQTHDVYCPELEEIADGSNFAVCAGISVSNTEPYSIYMPKLRKIGSGCWLFRQYNDCTSGVIRFVLGKIEAALNFSNASNMFTPNLIDLEFGQGTCANINLQYWNPTLTEANTATFLQNFREHIALRLTDQGSGKTLTLSQAVRDAIHAAEATYGIEAIIVTQKGWTLSPAPGASSQ